MLKRDYKSIPKNYSVCLHADCKMASSCLHQLVCSKLMEKESYLNLINPNMCGKNGKCKFFRDSKPVTFVRGFTKIQQNLSVRQYQVFMDTLRGVFGRNAYFERRSGRRAMPPEEQEAVLAVLKRLGVTEGVKFDSYEENIDW